MIISLEDWQKYKKKLHDLSVKASEDMAWLLETEGGYLNMSRADIIDYAVALSGKYGEATASLAAEMYDETAMLSGVIVPPAEVAAPASYDEIAKAINGVTKNLTTNENIASVVGRYVKRAGADTTLKNAKRDNAEYAWIPAGDTCIFCLMLASNGWQKASKASMQGGHATHIHANCDCTYMVRFDSKSDVRGYNPNKFKEMYKYADGSTSDQKINSLRRIQYQENKDKINAQKRANYAEKKEMEEE